MQILNCNSSHTISSVDVAKLMKEGYCNGLTVPYKILLNQGDDDEVRLKAVEIIEALKDLKIDEKTVVVGNTKK